MSNNVKNIDNSAITRSDTSLDQELLLDPQAYEKFLAACLDGLQKSSIREEEDLKDKHGGSGLMPEELQDDHGLQSEINLISQQISKISEFSGIVSSMLIPTPSEYLENSIRQELPDSAPLFDTIKEMQNKLKETSLELGNNFVSTQDVRQILSGIQQVLNNTMLQAQSVGQKKASTSVMVEPQVAMDVFDTEAPEGSAGSNNLASSSTTETQLQSNQSLQSGSTQSAATTTDQSITYVSSTSYTYNFSSINDTYSIFVLIGLLCLEVSRTVSDSTALTAQMLSMNQEYASELNDDMMAYVSLQSVVPYEYTDQDGNTVQTDDPYVIYSIIAISTPGSDSYDPESPYYDQDLAQKGSGFYQYMNEHCPDLQAYPPDEISLYLGEYDSENTPSVCNAYNEMAAAMEDLNNNIQDCATHLHINEPVLDFPETTNDVVGSQASYTVVTLDLDVLNQNQDTITKLQTQAEQLSETLTEELKVLMDNLTNWLKESNTAFEKYGSVTGSIITGQG